ncbi:MAG TPA: beta-ketoacyl-[acyl-carrier-protein] synthase family protein [Pirellulales bacterium]|jgi:3-oxoacyl-[acyl-carrier-protein] synthase II|nr:beta-ketoacyl-[acyl-carrier-protein] synthase family protein [Pirellulales bacterium]
MVRRVVITGIGLVSPLGNSKEALWDALVSGRSGVAPFESPLAEALPARFAAEAKFTGDIEEFGPLDKEQKKAIRKGLKLMCRESQMGVAAAQLALADAKIAVGGVDPERIGCVFGTDYMLTLPEDFSAAVTRCRSEQGVFDYSRWGKEGMAEITPLWLLKYLPNMPASHVAIYNDLRGPNNSITHREAAANLAVAEAFHTITRGSADIMAAGATGTRVHPMKSVHAAQQEELASNGVDPARASRPFDLNRDGMVLGEGAALVVLEELGSAQARGSTIYAEIVGTGSSQATDKNYVARRDVALANVIRRSIAEAGATPDDVGHIHAHGLSTHTSDADEARAIREVFGERADRIPVTAAKSYFGNLGAGSGMVELIASVLALSNHHLPPILNYETPDPECRITPAGAAHSDPGRNFINLSVTPQGQASAVMVRWFE